MSRIRAITIDADRAVAESKALGDAYLRQFARFFKMDGAPTLKAPSMNRMAKPGFPDPPRVPLDEETASVIAELVLCLPPDEYEVVLGYYVRRRRRVESNSFWFEPLRYWQTKELARLLGISERTLFRRLASARSRIESWAEQRDLPLPP